MTADTSGSGAPENDDPFAYLYRQEGGGAATDDAATAQLQHYGQPGVPRTSYNQVTRVGQTNYGQRGQQAGYGQQAGQAPGAAHPGGGPHGAQPQYGSPEAGPYPGGRAATRRGGAGFGGGGDKRGLLIGAVAVVLAVALGVGLAAWAGDDSDPQAKEPAPGSSVSAEESSKPKGSAAPEQPKNELPPVADAASLELAGGAKSSTEHSGALGDGGRYVDGMQAPGATVTWRFALAEGGQFRFNVRYANAGDNAKATLVVNGKTQSIRLDNFSKQGDWSKAWTRSYGLVTLEKGDNIIDLTCGAGDSCMFNVDQFAITRDGYPSDWP